MEVDEKVIELQNTATEIPTPSTSAVTLDESFPALWPQGHVPASSSKQAITRDNLVTARQSALERVADQHDSDVRELFHMDRVTSMVYFDPVVAKSDNSRVWQDFKQQFDLSSAVESTSLSALAGPKMRTTRRAANERNTGFGIPVKSTPEFVAPLPKKASTKARRQSAPNPETIESAPAPSSLPVKGKQTKGKGKARKSEPVKAMPKDEDDSFDYAVPKDDTPVITQSGRVSRARVKPTEASSLIDSLTEAPLPTTSRGRKGKAKSTITLPTTDPNPPRYASPTLESKPAKPLSKAPQKKNAPKRKLPEISPFAEPLKRLRLDIPDDAEMTTEEPDPTHPDQRPLAIPTKEALPTFLESYISIEDVTGNDERPREFTNRINHEASTFDKITLYRNEGRLNSLNPDRKTHHREKLRSKVGDHEDALVEAAIGQSKSLQEERKSKVGHGKKISRMVMEYFDQVENREERERERQERAMRALAKWTAREVRKKWRMAANLIRAQEYQAEQEEIERKGKEALNAILEKSSQFLTARKEDLAQNDREDSFSDHTIEEDEDDSQAEIDESRSVTQDPDGEFAEEEELLREYDDEEYAKEMEEEEGQPEAVNEESDEDQGLLEDADLPIEQLMAKYGYAPRPDGFQERSEPEDHAVDSPLLQDEASLSPKQDASSTAIASEVNQSQDPASAEADQDNEFAPPIDEAEEQADVDFDAAMDEDEEGSEDDDAEMNALAAEADVPIEQLLGGYQPSASPQPDDSLAVTSEDASLQEDEDVEMSDAVSQHSSNTSEEHIKVNVPFLLRGTLRPYQKAGLEWLASLYVNGLNGILADEMGLGKTLQTISLLAWLACEKGIWGPHLIVVPTSVMLNWEMEFKKFLPGFKILTYYGSIKERKEKRKGWNTKNQFHVCVTSYQLVLADQHMFRRKPWHYMVLDEAHHIKNFQSQRWQTLLGFNTKRRLLLTGTPLQNNLMELWSLLYFLMPEGMSGIAGSFANYEDFQQWFSNPMEKAIESGQQMDEETRATISRLHTILRPYLLRRLKADVETQMPGKYEHIITCRLSKRQRYLYDEFMSRAQTRDTLSSGHFLSIINCLMQLRKVCNHPDLFEVRPVVTSLAMPHGVASDFDVNDLLVRKRLLADNDGRFEDTHRLIIGRSEVACVESRRLNASDQLRRILAGQGIAKPKSLSAPIDVRTVAGWTNHLKATQYEASMQRIERQVRENDERCKEGPIMSSEVIHSVKLPERLSHSQMRLSPEATQEKNAVSRFLTSYEDRSDAMTEVVSKFAFATPAVVARDLPEHALRGVDEDDLSEEFDSERLQALHLANTKLAIAFPDRSLIQYDCGKLQKLDELLRQLKAGGHRALIFTQMTKVLDILEIFLSFHGHRYLRLDGSTKVEQRQILTERFNTDPRILCFISSTRAGGLGINLTGADTVVFYDSDWNPAMDRQCQDRCHRIGQTRDVHIYRFVCEATIEENMLKKANQKRMLDNMVIADGDFTTEYFAKMDWRDMLGDKLVQEIESEKQQKQPAATDALEDDSERPESAPEPTRAEILEALAAAEDEEDAEAAELAEEELVEDDNDFADLQEPGTATAEKRQNEDGVPAEGEEDQEALQVDDEDDLSGTVDGYMVNLIRLDEDLQEEL